MQFSAATNVQSSTGVDTPGRQARSWARSLHTGEALGIIGQTIAGLVSLTSLVMVWTGFALAYRRLVVTPLRRRRARSSAGS